MPRATSGSAAAIVMCLLLAACGAGSSHRSTSAAAGPQPEGLSFSRCMRSHGVPNFPDPAAGGGGFDLTNIPGVDTSAPAFTAARAACNTLLPVKHVPSSPPTAHAFARLLHWTVCMRAHGISGLPDPKPDPAPSPGSAAAANFRTLMGDGGYWVGIPAAVNAHSAAFTQLSTRCGESPGGPRS